MLSGSINQISSIRKVSFSGIAVFEAFSPRHTQESENNGEPSRKVGSTTKITFMKNFSGNLGLSYVVLTLS